MKIYIGWSGTRSKQVGKIFNEMLPFFNHESEPFFSPEMGKGIQWLSTITEELRDSAIGIFCLTRENLNAPWILFEAGALSKGLQKNNVCTFLLDLKTSDITEPLSQFQWTINTEEDLFRLINTINLNAKKPLNENVLSQNYKKYYPEFEKKIKEIPPYKEKTGEGLPPLRDQGEILEEILGILRDMKREEFIDSETFMIKHGARMMRNKRKVTLEVVPDMRDQIREQLMQNTAFKNTQIKISQKNDDTLIIYYYGEFSEEQIIALSLIKGIISIDYQYLLA